VAVDVLLVEEAWELLLYVRQHARLQVDQQGARNVSVVGESGQLEAIMAAMGQRSPRCGATMRGRGRPSRRVWTCGFVMDE